MAMRPVLRELLRLEMWNPIIETMDPPAPGPFTAAWTHEMAPNGGAFNPFTLMSLEAGLSRRGKRREQRAHHEARSFAWRNRAGVGPLIHSPGAFHRLAWTILCHLKLTPEQGELIRELLTVRVMRTKKLRGLVRSNWNDLQLIEHYERPKSKAALPAELESDLYGHFVEKVLDDRRMVHDDCWGLLYTAARNFVLNLLEEVQVRKRHSVPVSGDDADLNVLEDTALTELAMQARDERLHETDDRIESFLTRLQTEQVLALIKPDLTKHQAQFLDQLLPLLRQDRTVKESAAEMGISADLAYVYLHRIRKLYKRFSE